MKRLKYKPEHEEFIAAAYQKHTPSAVAKEFTKKFGIDRTPGQIKSYLSARKITCGRSPGEATKGISRLFTQEQADWIKKAFKKMQVQEFTPLFNKKFGTQITKTQFDSFISNHKLTCGRTGRFKKGNKSWNEGTKGLTGKNKTSFKKGTLPYNTAKIGSERITRDGFIEVKVDNNKKWISKQRIVWEQHNGPIPKNHLIRFIDNNQLNTSINNLLLVNMAENMALNRMKYANKPAEIKPTMLLMAKIEAKACQLRKQRDEA